MSEESISDAEGLKALFQLDQAVTEAYHVSIQVPSTPGGKEPEKGSFTRVVG